MKARTESGVWPYGVFMGYKPSSVPSVREPDGLVADVIRRAMEGYAYGDLVSFEDVGRFINQQNVTNYILICSNDIMTSVVNYRD